VIVFNPAGGMLKMTYFCFFLQHNVDNSRKFANLAVEKEC
jgi:hypothetical protein